MQLVPQAKQVLIQKQSLSKFQIQSQQMMMLNISDLRHEIEQVVSENPALESEYTDDSLDLDDTENTSYDEWPTEWEKPQTNLEASPPLEASLTSEESLKDHLLWQISLSNLTIEERNLAEPLTETLDLNGFLTTSIETLFKALDHKLVYSILPFLQSLDPVGCYTTSASESLLIQVKLDSQNNPHIPLHTEKFIEQFLIQKKNNFPKLSMTKVIKALDITLDELEAIYLYLKQLSPYPGREYNKKNSPYITPDIYVERFDDELIIRNNEAYLPAVKLSDEFATFYQKSSQPEEKKFIQNKIEEAQKFLNLLTMRNQTISRIARILVEEQKLFFLTGDPDNLVHLTLQHIANRLDFHASTISRAVKQKYLYCDWGFFEMKYFISGNAHLKISPSNSTEEQTNTSISQESVKAKIIEIRKAYTGTKKISAQKITDLLQEQYGIKIARRTVSKYLNQL